MAHRFFCTTTRTCDRRSGSACRLHAANSYFADADSADLHRAHPHCRCRVVAGPTDSAATFGVLFGGATIARPRVDARTPWVRDALADARFNVVRWRTAAPQHPAYAHEFDGH